ncbi:hypothetical protein AMAG_08767 [Allomyces macrogynus ATCC 38327]|uniref:Uncharacterized protein n=1 Tax=Allomyces macrogynus (strain ATCC 38327) TaxID=578462 RepID=A0A0L0SMR5_ALLM3|nr:hypothetical protein AMAG_08767 [Allomyces macrogynus ATCC 38327]|eukprot:KNE63669.1 hypothetical protein AMAG_08767 [Allomyces macrogynus ATCC 38327]
MIAPTMLARKSTTACIAAAVHRAAAPTTTPRRILASSSTPTTTTKTAASFSTCTSARSPAAVSLADARRDLASPRRFQAPIARNPCFPRGISTSAPLLEPRARPSSSIDATTEATSLLTHDATVDILPFPGHAAWPALLDPHVDLVDLPGLFSPSDRAILATTDATLARLADDWAALEMTHRPALELAAAQHALVDGGSTADLDADVVAALVVQVPTLRTLASRLANYPALKVRAALRRSRLAVHRAVAMDPAHHPLWTKAWSLPSSWALHFFHAQLAHVKGVAVLKSLVDVRKPDPSTSVAHDDEMDVSWPFPAHIDASASRAVSNPPASQLRALLACYSRDDWAAAPVFTRTQLSVLAAVRGARNRDAVWRHMLACGMHWARADQEDEKAKEAMWRHLVLLHAELVRAGLLGGPIRSFDDVVDVAGFVGQCLVAMESSDRGDAGAEQRGRGSSRGRGLSRDGWENLATAANVAGGAFTLWAAII